MKLETKRNWKLIHKIHQALLLVIMLGSFGVYSYGIICHTEAAFCTGLLGIMFGIPLWCYLANVLENRERKELKERKVQKTQKALETHYINR